jgi:Fic family protein
LDENNLIGYNWPSNRPTIMQLPKITPEILKLISEIDEFKGTWRALKTLAPERLAALKKIATIESIGSSTRIEGSKLSDKQVEKLLSIVGKESFASRDEQEVAGYAEAMELIFNSWESIPLSENYIKQLHKLLLKHSTKDERHRGEYKKFPNSVQAFDADRKNIGTIFETTSPFDTPREMKLLVTWTSKELESGELHPIIVIGIFVVRFLAIHPFQDGNGRLSRVLTTLLLLQKGYAYVPYSSLESVIEENKDSYYLALRHTQITLNKKLPDLDPWLLFFLRAIQRQKARLQMRIDQETSLFAKLPPLSVTILELAAQRGRITTGDIEKVTKESRSTIKNRLNDLVDAKLLDRTGKGRGTWYSR